MKKTPTTAPQSRSSAVLAVNLSATAARTVRAWQAAFGGDPDDIASGLISYLAPEALARFRKMPQAASEEIGWMQDAIAAARAQRLTG